MTTNSEKRANQRVPKNTPILFTMHGPDDSGAQAQPHERQNATILDISATGMGIFTTTHIKTGQLIHFIKDQPHWQLPAQGLVVWCLKHGAGFRAGLEFIM